MAPFMHALLHHRTHPAHCTGFTAASISALLFSAGAFVLTKDVRPTLDTLEALLGGDRPAAIAAACKGESLITCNPATLRANWALLTRDVGLPVDEARALLRRAPKLFKLALTGDGMRAKQRYYTEIFGISQRDLLLDYPSYLDYSLAKVDLRIKAGSCGGRSRMHQLP